MKKILIALVVLGCVFSFTNAAHAIVSDLPDVGTTGYFLDESTGYTWMDVDNFLNMTYNEVLSAISGTNFHVATYAELLQLQASAPAYTSSFYSDYAIMGGSPWSGSDIIWAMYEDGDSDPAASWSWKYNSTNSGYWYYNGTPGGNEVDREYTRQGGMGAFVVNNGTSDDNCGDAGCPVPEPASLSLLGLGLIGLIGRKRIRG